jgi:putative Holliday junction resolvase
MGNNYLALDVGDRRVGLSVARSDVRFAIPKGAIDRSVEDVWAVLLKLIEDEDIGTVVMGLPRGLDGQETAQTAITREFAADFEARLGILVQFQDEAGTSRQAEDALRARKVSYTKSDIDALAATTILTDYLSEHREA